MKENENIINQDFLDENLNNNRKNSYKKYYFAFIIFPFIILGIIIFLLIKFISSDESYEIYSYFNFTILNNSISGPANILVEWEIQNISDFITFRVKDCENNNIRIYNFKDITGEAIIQVYYGLPKIEIFYGNKVKTKTKSYEFNITIDEIVIAPLVASLPVSIFSLSIFDILNTYKCPIYVFIERYKAWNWDSLPENVFLIDFIDQNNFKNIK